MPLSTTPGMESASRPTVLIFDERANGPKSLRSLLDDADLEILSALTEDEVEAQIRSRRVSAIVIRRQEFSAPSLEMLRRLRTHDEARNVPLLLVIPEECETSILESAFQLGPVDLISERLAPSLLRVKAAAMVDQFLERKNALHEAETLRFLVQGTADYAIFMLDPEGYIQTWNRGAERLKGYQPSEIIGQHFSRFYGSSDIERGWPQHELDEAKSIGRFEDEGWRYRKDGTRFWANVVITALRDSTGVLRGFSKVTRDLTSRKEAEEALRRSEEGFRLIVDTVKDYAIFRLDPEGRVATWNQGAEGIKQYRANEIIGRHFSQFYPREAIDRGWPEYELRCARIDGRFEDEGWRLRKDGSEFWANVVITALKDDSGNLRGYSKITRDMTERRNSEEAARLLLAETTARRVAEEKGRLVALERERLRITLESLGDAVITTDAESRVEFLNPMAEQLTDWTSAEATGVYLTDVFQIVNETSRETVDNPALRALREGRIVGLANHTILISKSGKEIPIDDSAAPIHDAEGNIVGSVLVFRDISSLRKANHALQLADRQKDEFLAMLAHELRNPLATIRSGLELLCLEETGSNETLDLMQHQVDHMVRLVDDLLDVSRIVRQKIELRWETVELSSIVQRSVQSLLPTFHQQGHEMRVALPAETIWLRADPIRLAQVLENLLNNAAKYTPPRGKISMSVVCTGSEVSIAVQDNGIGIEPELQAVVFDLFTQSSRALDRSQGGLGIGLTLVRELVRLHGGTVDVTSPGPNQGSTFTVRLPLASAPEIAAPLPEQVTACRALRILAVDDNVGAAKLLSRMLVKLGNHQVTLAHNGEDAIQKAEECRPELILTDIGLPGLNGYDVAREIRSRPEFDDVLLVALTGYGQDEDRRKSHEAGFDEHFVKPLSLQTLQSLFRHPKINLDTSP